MNQEELKELAAQLRQPKGDKGIEVADLMNDTNISMTHHAIEKLNILDNDKIMELGHGNCKHLSHLLNQKNNLTYYGLELSELMNKEAERINQQFIKNKQAHFVHYNGLEIPFSDNNFNKIFTVNTIYFWSDPTHLLDELFRILKPNGTLCITFAQQKFMQQLPFTEYGFTLYDNEKLTKLIATTPFKIIDCETQTETIKSKMGDSIERGFTTFILVKES